MGLCVVDHLHSVLDRSEQPIRGRQLRRLLLLEAVSSGEGRNCIERGRRANGSIAAAMDHLLDLHEKLDLADTAPPALQVITGPNVRSLREMISDARRDLPNFLDHAKIERAPPHERLDCVEELLAEREVP